jgi:hypothetical protein
MLIMGSRALRSNDAVFHAAGIGIVTPVSRLQSFCILVQKSSRWAFRRRSLNPVLGVAGDLGASIGHIRTMAPVGASERTP